MEIIRKNKKLYVTIKVESLVLTLINFVLLLLIASAVLSIVRNY